MFVGQGGDVAARGRRVDVLAYSANSHVPPTQGLSVNKSFVLASGFWPTSAAPQSQNPQRSPATPAVLLNRRDQNRSQNPVRSLRGLFTDKPLSLQPLVFQSIPALSCGVQCVTFEINGLNYDVDPKVQTNNQGLLRSAHRGGKSPWVSSFLHGHITRPQAAVVSTP